MTLIPLLCSKSLSCLHISILNALSPMSDSRLAVASQVTCQTNKVLNKAWIVPNDVFWNASPSHLPSLSLSLLPSTHPQTYRLKSSNLFSKKSSICPLLVKISYFFPVIPSRFHGLCTLIKSCLFFVAFLFLHFSFRLVSLKTLHTEGITADRL